jgi:phosphomannomutase/phosphoglucomutase
MRRVFSLLAAFTILMILIVGGGIYWWSSARIAQARLGSATAIVNAAALTLSEQIELLNRTLNKMAQDPEVLVAVTSADPVLLTTVAARLEKYFPDALKIRLLLPGVSKLDEKNTPRMGFADVDMVRETFTNSQPPRIQGYEGTDRHLAITHRIMYNDQVIGVILASLNYDFFNKSIEAAAVKNGYIELRQANMVLGASGKRVETGRTESLQTKVASTSWEIYYQYATGVDLAEIILITSTIGVPVLLTILAFWVGYWRLSGLMAQDLNSVLSACKDMMSHKSLGCYPVNLSEITAVIVALRQFKRALDHKDNEAIVREGGDLELDGLTRVDFSNLAMEENQFTLTIDKDDVIKRPKNISNE